MKEQQKVTLVESKELAGGEPGMTQVLGSLEKAILISKVNMLKD